MPYNRVDYEPDPGVSRPPQIPTTSEYLGKQYDKWEDIPYDYLEQTGQGYYANVPESQRPGAGGTFPGSRTSAPIDLGQDPEQQKMARMMLIKSLIEKMRQKQDPEQLISRYGESRKRDIKKDFGDTMSAYQNLMNLYSQRFG